MNNDDVKPAKKPWPTSRDNAEAAVSGFSAALTRAGSEKSFRDLLKTGPDTKQKEIRQAVSDEGDVEIPEDIVLLFHELDDCKNIYPFFLPKPGETLEPYHRYFQGCFSKFRLANPPAAKVEATTAGDAEKRPAAGEAIKTWDPANKAEVFTKVLKRSQTDPEFRKRLTSSMTEAKKAVAEEGNITIPDEVIILFHEDESNEKFHMFRLPPHNEGKKTPYEYRLQFEGFYFVW